MFLTPLLKLILTKNMIITGKTQNRIEITEEALDDDFDFCPISISIFNFFQALTIVFLRPKSTFSLIFDILI